MTNSKPQGSALYTSLEVSCHVNGGEVVHFFPSPLQPLSPLLELTRFRKMRKLGSSESSGEGCGVRKLVLK